MAREPVYSIRIFAQGALTGTHPVTVPAGLVYVLRDVDVWSRTQTSGDAFAILGSNAQLLWFVAIPPLVNPWIGQWRGRQIFNAGETVTFESAGGEWDVTASGYQLTLP